MSLAADVLAACRARHWRIAAAESCTGGLVMAALTDIAGSSDVVDRGFVTYSNAAKSQMLNVSEAVIEQYGAVSEQVAGQMAQGALQASQADIAVAITGVAGPGGTALKPEGMVCFGLASRDADLFVTTEHFGPLGRLSVRARSVEKALALLLARTRQAASDP